MTSAYGVGGDGRPADRSGLPRALIVDDEILVAWELQSILEELGFQAADLASDGMSALRLVESTPFGVLFLDVNLSRPPDGVETARRIREHLATPIIFVTAYSAHDSIYDDLRRISRSAVIGKPATLATVFEALSKLGLSPTTV